MARKKTKKQQKKAQSKMAARLPLGLRNAAIGQKPKGKCQSFSGGAASEVRKIDPAEYALQKEQDKV